jgi:holo-[acyl-carrier protein] synthase
VSESLSSPVVDSSGVTVETGVDVVSIDRIRRLVTDGPTGFVDRVFTADEQSYCDDTRYPAEHYAARWCVKETVRKLVDASSGVSLRDVATRRTETGAPRLVVLDTARQAVTETFGVPPSADAVDTSVSLTHDRKTDTATAVVTVAVGGGGSS